MSMEFRKLIRPEDQVRLIRQEHQSAPVRGTVNEIEHTWAVRLYLPFTQCQWIITELERDGRCAFGGAQITCWELGGIWLPELAELDVRGLRVKQDLAFNGGGKTLTEWSDIARSSPGGMLPPVM